MRGPRVRFTIRGMMIAVAIVAVVLILIQSAGGLLFGLAMSWLALAGGVRELFRRRRRRAVWCFGIAAVATNGAVATLCVSA
jgi:hypothetical protein